MSYSFAKEKSKGRVLVAMSGGVDSSVAAALLVEQGYDVIGVIMQVWDYSSCSIEEGNGTCCSSIDVEDARAVADHLNIPFYVVNCEEKFTSTVIDDFVDSYLEGKTPIPCVNCNTFLKFDHLLHKMEELQCDYLATGHYAQIQQTESGPAIVTSSDSWKDQTYFLFTLDPKILPRLMFPVGTWEKPQLRDYARENALPVAEKKDSTGICFIGKEGYKDFVEQRAPKHKVKPGLLKRYPDGKVYGSHTGIHRFTKGQRKGLGVYEPEPVYVIRIDADTGDVWLGDNKYLYESKMKVKELHLLNPVQSGERLKVKIRFHHEGVWAKLTKSSEGYEFEFEEPQRAVTPGQAAVIYRDRQLVGGGWIL